MSYSKQLLPTLQSPFPLRCVRPHRRHDDDSVRPFCTFISVHHNRYPSLGRLPHWPDKMGRMMFPSTPPPFPSTPLSAPKGKEREQAQQNHHHTLLQLSDLLKVTAHRQAGAEPVHSCKGTTPTTTTTLHPLELGEKGVGVERTKVRRRKSPHTHQPLELEPFGGRRRWCCIGSGGFVWSLFFSRSLLSLPHTIAK